MKKIAYLISHSPNPRMYKRMNVVKNDFDVSVLFWKRSFNNNKVFFDDKKIIKHEIVSDNFSYKFNLFARIIISAKFLYRAVKILKRSNPEVVHCEHLDMLFIASFYSFFLNKNVKIIYEVADLHDIQYSDKRTIVSLVIKHFFRKIEKNLCKKIEYLIVTSPFFYDDYYKNMLKKSKVLFIPNAPEKRIFRNFYEEKRIKPCIGFIGAIRYVPQLKLLIDVVKELGSFTVFLAGLGSGSDEIKQYAKNLDFVEFYGAYDYEKDISVLYSKIDIVYSVYDTSSKNVRVALPNRLYEGIVTEKPIIASKNTKLGDFIINNKIGFTIDESISDELKNLLIELSENYNNIINPIKENMAKIKNEFYIDDYNKQLYDIYRNL